MIGSRCLKTNGAAPALHLFLGKDEEKLKIIKVISRTAGFHITFPRQLHRRQLLKASPRGVEPTGPVGSARPQGGPVTLASRGEKVAGGDADVCEVNKRKSEVIMREK